MGGAVLVLTRRVGESVCIGDDVEVMVFSVGRNQVRIGITAPPAVAVHREEVLARVRARSGALGLRIRTDVWAIGPGPLRSGVLLAPMTSP